MIPNLLLRPHAHHLVQLAREDNLCANAVVVVIQTHSKIARRSNQARAAIQPESAAPVRHIRIGRYLALLHIGIRRNLDEPKLDDQWPPCRQLRRCAWRVELVGIDSLAPTLRQGPTELEVQWRLRRPRNLFGTLLTCVPTQAIARKTLIDRHLASRLRIDKELRLGQRLQLLRRGPIKRVQRDYRDTVLTLFKPRRHVRVDIDRIVPRAGVCQRE